MSGGIRRCVWAVSERSIDYHDREWGVPVHDDRVLFEFLVLEGAQAGLSWETILKKRENYRKAFAGFDPKRVARFDAAKIGRLLEDPGIVRNRLKVESALSNARAFLDTAKEFGSFEAYVWRFVGGKPRTNRFRHLREIPAKTPEAEALSKDLKERGFRFVGPTICYAFMQTVGMVNDHTVDCFRHREVARLAGGSPRRGAGA
ncbi:MAG: DNA-3-methyladenine glycosylase I [Candidatus Eisenbacteria bacterium]